ncbi:ATP-binding protein [Phaeobacter sp. C3_T13_0]|uniref:ATP-binding protein n=1 Tax=Phaeobacter cretensis TaxID=3342641 RepID=UPI0039BC9133
MLSPAMQRLMIRSAKGFHDFALSHRSLFNVNLTGETNQFALIESDQAGRRCSKTTTVRTLTKLGRRMRLFSLSPDLKNSVATQNELVRADLPSRFASITLVSLLSLYFLPLQTVVIVYAAYVLIEVIGLRVYHRLAREITVGATLLFGFSAFVGVWVFNALSLLLFLHPEPFPKLMGAMLLIIALNHSVVARSAWIHFGFITAVPIICTVTYMIYRTLIRFASMGEMLIAAVIVLLGAVYMLHAMWVQHVLTARLQDALKEAKAGSRAKSRFLAAMSHEIRTPLNAICGMSELIEEENSDSGVLRERTQLLRKSAQALTGILDDVLDHAKIESGQFELKLAPALPREEISSVVEMYRLRAVEKGLDLNTRISDNFPIHAECDALRLRQIIGNLVSNAVKYTETGHVTVVADSENMDGRTILRLEVSDTGRGMTAQQTAKLFTDFYRVNDKNAPNVPGTGLGLSIARNLARIMGGDITVQTSPDWGSCFTFSWPATILNAPEVDAVQLPEKTIEHRDLEGLSILLVDDTASNRLVVRAFLKNSNVTIMDAENGFEALTCLEQYAFDVVLLDMKMPVMDGRETLVEMAKRGGKVSGTPVIMLTANAAPEEQDLFIELGAASYLAKPVKKSVLIAEICKVTATSIARTA